ncbi:MAG TPA: hypothetical protein ENN40_02815 [Candidatus Aminicenantes bacterium]|nr:hypothetical protein [Candidatus Aminicenantes bacterium]
MMRRYVMALLGLILVSTWIQAQGFRMHRDVSVEPGETVAENVLAWKGRVDIQGTLEESLFLIGGSARISGIVKKDVIGFSANIELLPGTVILGELLMIGGELNRKEDVRIEGGHLHFRYDLKRLRSSLHPIFSESRSMGFFRAAKIIIWFVITLLTFVLFPRSVMYAEGVLSARTWRLGITGLGTLLVFIALTLLCLFLSFILIGIPLLFLLILAWFAVLVLGRTVVFYAIGRRLMQRAGYAGSSVPLALLVATVGFGLLKFVPLVGTAALLLLNLVEIGTGAAYLMRRLRRQKVT